AGGYTDWLRQRPLAAPVPQPKRPVARAAPAKVKKRKLTFKETSELATLPDRIDALEREREALYASLGDAGVLRDGAAVVAAKTRIAAIEAEMPELLARWETLETIASDA